MSARGAGLAPDRGAGMTTGLSDADQELVRLARAIIWQRYRPGWHVVGAALRTRAGRVFTGVHLEAYVGRIAICAEAVTLGRAATEAGDTDIETIVAVRHAGGHDPGTALKVAAPCGMCREMIADYSPAAAVIVPSANGLVRKPIAWLLPDKYVRD
ncbi:cytidine deaminase [Rhodopila sp.]|jgi:cytidine deaminase|uniref:cytidine deaminase n=1 Tax=Rhodopila sp. TaxID=2480087 RepID=UPI002BCDC4C0|nr:cytidine deaminase [Rhodopila sp.]HVZ07867.1 cytidine deaminase [Rhodopila sp.]